MPDARCPRQLHTQACQGALTQSQGPEPRAKSLGEPEPSWCRIPTCVRGLSQGSLAGLTRGARLGNPWLRLLSCGSSPGQGFSERDVDSSLGTSVGLDAVGNRRRRPMSGQPIWDVRMLLSAVCVSGWCVCVGVYGCMCTHSWV